MSKRSRRLLTIASVFLFLVVGAVFLLVRGMAHRVYVVEGNIEIKPPISRAITAPAVVCAWANSYKAAIPGALRTPDEAQTYVICDLSQPSKLPFRKHLYSTTSRGYLIGAFVRAIPESHPACAKDRAAVAVERETRLLDELCSQGDLPPRSDIALMAPFDDDEGRPTPWLRIAVGRAE